ncbi:diacylglycerol/lipid kinase family protein [Aestuariivirga sp.]|uniref:diacylglycerol/lipid kinase family protein n=1 Tax=Aestuariivirga sp. TaxID=2650926 RepID=UPI0039E25926
MDKTQPAEAAVLVIINRQSGTVRTMGEDAVAQRVEKGFSQKQPVEVSLVKGGEIASTVASAIAGQRYQTIVVGGGDGTVASVAGQLAGTGITMGVLPLGTMNMVAQAIGIPANLEQAVTALADGHAVAIDVGRVNGKAFLHQVSFGIQPRVVRIRERIGYSSRLTKMLTGLTAIFAVLARPRTIRMIAEEEGTLSRLRIPALAISNNVYRSDKPGIPVRLDGGVLGIYAVSAKRWRDYIRIALATLRGTWKEERYGGGARRFRDQIVTDEAPEGEQDSGVGRWRTRISHLSHRYFH